MNVHPLGRASYRDIAVYSPDREPVAIDLSDNTNCWGTPPSVQRALQAMTMSSVTRYPSLASAELTRALAGYMEVEPEMIVTGCGSDDVLDSAIRAFGEPGDLLACPAPTFVMIPIFARLNGLEPVAVPLTASLDLDADAMLATGARIIYVCSPNNPTGNTMTRGAIERIVRDAPGLVIIDEAYAEFAGTDSRDLARSSDNVLVTRTLSKAFGLAGLRIGYGAGSPAVIREVSRSRGPYKVNAVAERAALSALGEGLGWVRERVAEAVENRERLAGELQSRGVAVLPSSANFVMAPLAGAVSRAARMRALGVAVRAFDGLPQLNDALRASRGSALRIAVGPWEQIETMLAAFDATAERDS